MGSHTRARRKINKWIDIRYGQIYKEKDIDPKKLDMWLKDGLIYEFKHGHFKKL